MIWNELELPEAYYQDDAVYIIHADCRDVLPLIPDKSIDLVLTDPPYGVNLGKADNGQCKEKGQMHYSQFVDTPEYVKNVVVPVFNLCLQKCHRAIVTPGNRNAWDYPKPEDIGVWYNPAGTGRGKWGFILAHIILYYGVDPRAGRNATASSAHALNDSVKNIKNILHPCPKPLKFTKWLISKGSTNGEIVLDPFAGSGTTVIAAKHLNRKCIGIEIEERYAEIAAKRCSQSVMRLSA